MIKAIQRSKVAQKKLSNLDLIIKRHAAVNSFTQTALHSNVPLVSDDGADVTISLTTYSHRIHDVHLVIESLGEQTLKARRIVLWLDEEEFANRTLPIMLQKQTARGLDIRYCPNLRSYKKLLPSLEAFAGSDIITVDDDVLYPYYFVEQLMLEKEVHPNTVLCYRAHRMTFDNDGNINPYREWKKATQDPEPSYRVVPTGVGGVFYPAGSLDGEVTNFDLASKLAPHADDVWFKFMTLLNQVQSKVVDRKVDFEHDFIELSTNQDMALNAINVHGKRNDEQIAKMYDHFKPRKAMALLFK